jgi:hypothetical protein
MNHHHLPYLVLCLALAGCETQGGERPLHLEFPSLPPAWTELLGSPRWILRYYDRSGAEAHLETGGDTAELSLPPARVSPVLAWPYWPQRRLNPGDFRPAGAVLPYDIRFPGGESAPGRIALSWQGGVDAWFFEALNRAAAEQPAGGAEERRRGEQFDWPAFRALCADPAVLGELRQDPWLADWEAIAEQTLRSGFRAQRLKAVETSPLDIPVPPGSWISPSPLAPPVMAGTGTAVFEVPGGSAVHAWYSAGGILHCAATTWILLPWD